MNTCGGIRRGASFGVQDRVARRKKWRRREQLEKRVNELVEENKRSRAVAEEAQRSANIRTELQKLGVTKVDLAYKAVQDGIVRTEDGRLIARGENWRTDSRGVPGELRSRKPGVSAGADCRRDRNDGNAKGHAPRQRRGIRPGQDQPVDEQRGTGASAPGDFAGGNDADAAGSVVPES